MPWQVFWTAATGKCALRNHSLSCDDVKAANVDRCSFFLVPVIHFPWSERGSAAKGGPSSTTVNKTQAKV